MDAAFNVMKAALPGTSQTIDSTYVNFATDGVPNNQALATAARNSLIAAASVDNLSVEAIGSGVDATYLMDQICYPGPCDDRHPTTSRPRASISRWLMLRGMQRPSVRRSVS